MYGEINLPTYLLSTYIGRKYKLNYWKLFLYKHIFQKSILFQIFNINTEAQLIEFS